MGLLWKANPRAVAEKQKKELLLKNEENFLESIRNLCTEDRIYDPGRNRKVYYPEERYNFYELGNGVKVILSKGASSWMCIYTGEIEASGLPLGAHIFKNEKDLVYFYRDYDIGNDRGPGEMSLIKFSETSGMEQIGLAAIDVIEKPQYGKYLEPRKSKKDVCDFSGNTMFEVIEENLNGPEFDNARGVVDVILNDFKSILSLVPEREIKPEDPGAIALRESERENKELRSRVQQKDEQLAELSKKNEGGEKANEQLKEENAELKDENESLKTEIERQKKRNAELIKKAKEFKDFVIGELDKLPIIGKIVKKKVIEKLNENELPEGRE